MTRYEISNGTKHPDVPFLITGHIICIIIQRQEIEEKAKEEERRKTTLGGRGERREKGEEMGEVQVEEQSRVRVAARRRVPFRLTSSKKTEQTAGAGESRKTEQPATAEETRETLEYEVIDEEEERERLAGLQVRERLVRNLDLPQTLSFLLASPRSPPPLPTSTLPLPRRHSSTHHCSHITQSTPQPLLSLHSKPFVTKSGSVTFSSVETLMYVSSAVLHFAVGRVLWILWRHLVWW